MWFVRWQRANPDGEILLKRAGLWQRQTLPRETLTVQTCFGEVRVKIGRLQGRPIHVAPEYEDCRQLAETGKTPVGDIIAAAVEAARALLTP